MRVHAAVADLPATGSRFRSRRMHRPEVGRASGPGPAQGVGGTTPFRVVPRDGGLSLAGDVDTGSADRLARTLASHPVAGSACTLDLADLTFADVAACRVLARWARTLAGRDVSVELADAPPLLERMWHVLGLADWAPVEFRPAG